jgi:hypothetical protein
MEGRKLNRPPHQKKDPARIIHAYVSLMEQADRFVSWPQITQIAQIFLAQKIK